MMWQGVVGLLGEMKSSLGGGPGGFAGRVGDLSLFSPGMSSRFLMRAGDLPVFSIGFSRSFWGVGCLVYWLGDFSVLCIFGWLRCWLGGVWVLYLGWLLAQLTALSQ